MFDMDEFDLRAYHIAWLVSQGWVLGWDARWHCKGAYRVTDYETHAISESFTLQEAIDFANPPRGIESPPDSNG